MMADWLSECFPLEDMPGLVNRQMYTLAHELTGAHDAIAELRELANALEQANGSEESE